MKEFTKGSRVQKVWDKYRAEGAEAAFVFGLTLDLKHGTLREWMRMYAKLLGQTAPSYKAPPVPTSEKAPRKSKPKFEMPSKVEGIKHGPRASANDRVYSCGDPRITGTVLKAGPESSLVKWDNGNVIDTPNGNLHKTNDEYERLNSTGKWKNYDKSYKGGSGEETKEVPPQVAQVKRKQVKSKTKRK